MHKANNTHVQRIMYDKTTQEAIKKTKLISNIELYSITNQQTI